MYIKSQPVIEPKEEHDAYDFFTTQYLSCQ